MPNLSTPRLKRLKEQRDKLEARIQLAEARAKHNERKQDTRRKILVGAYYLEQAKKDHHWEALKDKMDTFLTRDSDRKLFELPTKASVSDKAD